MSAAAAVAHWPRVTPHQPRPGGASSPNTAESRWPSRCLCDLWLISRMTPSSHYLKVYRYRRWSPRSQVHRIYGMCAKRLFGTISLYCTHIKCYSLRFDWRFRILCLGGVVEVTWWLSNDVVHNSLITAAVPPPCPHDNRFQRCSSPGGVAAAPPDGTGNCPLSAIIFFYSTTTVLDTSTGKFFSDSQSGNMIFSWFDAWLTH